MPKPITISFYTLGCRTNQAETAALANFMEKTGNFTIERAGIVTDIAVVNTCTVTQNSDTDTRKLINRLVRLNPKIQIALIGCQAQVQKNLLADLPNVKWIIGNQNKMKLDAFLSAFPVSKPLISIPPIRRATFTMPAASVERFRTRANLKIQDGCDAFCSYCEVPYARGRARSREFNDIIKEALVLTEAGHKEIILTGIHIGKYQQDHKTLLDVIDALEQIPGLARLRISSIEPSAVLQKLVNKMAGQTKLCRYLHIPIQSANDKILSLMNRSYRSSEILDFISRAVSAVPGICIGSDIIVGFPGETDELFEETLAKLAGSDIHYFHVFSYSQRLKAKSKNFSGQVGVPAIQKRSRILRNLSQAKRAAFYTGQLNKIYPVLFEQKKAGDWTGLTDNFLHVKVKSSRRLHNQIIPVRLTQVHGQWVGGETNTQSDK